MPDRVVYPLGRKPALMLIRDLMTRPLTDRGRGDPAPSITPSLSWKDRPDLERRRSFEP